LSDRPWDFLVQFPHLECDCWDRGRFPYIVRFYLQAPVHLWVGLLVLYLANNIHKFDVKSAVEWEPALGSSIDLLCPARLAKPTGQGAKWTFHCGTLSRGRPCKAGGVASC
jgi:hypothetical protein